MRGSRATERRSKPRSVGSVVRGAPWIPLGGSASDGLGPDGLVRTLLFFICPPAWNWLTPLPGRHFPPPHAPRAVGGWQESSPILSNESSKTPNRNDPMLTCNTPTQHKLIEQRPGADRVMTSAAQGMNATQSAGSLQHVRGLTPSNTLPPHSSPLESSDDGTMKGPTRPSCFGGRGTMVRPARVGICAVSRMEEWTQRSLWGQHYGPGSQEKEMCARPRNGDSAHLAAPRADGTRRWPNRRGESTALLSVM